MNLTCHLYLVLLLFKCCFTEPIYKKYYTDDDNDQLSLDELADLIDFAVNRYPYKVQSQKVKVFEKPHIKFTDRLTDNQEISENIGSIGGLAVDKNENLIVFHRASREWKGDSFLRITEFNREKYGVINENCITNIDPKTMKVLNSWGGNKFYMPHGVFIDSSQNIWLSDVGLHQVFKFNPDNLETPSLVLGVAFENGNDEKHFCKPADIAIMESNGDIFVADGYCNSRVVQFDKTGNFKKIFQLDIDKMIVVHSLTLIEDLNLVCAADRENGRVICFDIDTAEVKYILKHPRMQRVFGIRYDKNFKFLHAISGDSGVYRPLGFTFHIGNRVELLQIWQPNDMSFSDPHALAVSSNGSTIYVGELNKQIERFKLI